MSPLPGMPSTTSIFSAYASVAAFIMLVQSIVNQFVPHQLRTYLLSMLSGLLNHHSSNLTLVIEEFEGFVLNQVYEASETYQRTKISPAVDRLRVSKVPSEKTMLVTIEKGEEIIDIFQGIQLKWKLISTEIQKSNSNSHGRSNQPTGRRAFELSFRKNYKEKVLDSYLPYVHEKAEAIKQENKVVKLHTVDNGWESTNLDHPSTFTTLAMDPELKIALIHDLNRFLKRKEFYRRVGKAWKRGYLLYGPPGTGKSSLIAAMANYLKFDIYDLELSNIYSDSDLRELLVATTNRSIIVIEDIDCTAKVQNRSNTNDPSTEKVSLSGLLNFSDGLWSSCGDERIMVFTTNHKDRLDPALLRPGRMDMHILMSYCTPSAFELLAFNYLGIKEQHPLFDEIKGILEDVEVTPAEIAEELLKNDDVEIVLAGLVQFLLQKKNGKDAAKDDGEKEVESQDDMQKNENTFEKSHFPIFRRPTRGRGTRRRRWQYICVDRLVVLRINELPLVCLITLPATFQMVIQF